MLLKYIFKTSSEWTSTYGTNCMFVLYEVSNVTGPGEDWEREIYITKTRVSFGVEVHCST